MASACGRAGLERLPPDRPANRPGCAVRLRL